MAYDIERMRTNFRMLEAYGPTLTKADQQWLEQKILEVIAEMLEQKILEAAMDHGLATKQQPPCQNTNPE